MRLESGIISDIKARAERRIREAFIDALQLIPDPAQRAEVAGALAVTPFAFAARAAVRVAEVEFPGTERFITPEYVMGRMAAVLIAEGVKADEVIRQTEAKWNR